MIRAEAPLRLKRPPRPRGRDLPTIATHDVVIDFARSAVLVRLCADLVHLEPTSTSTPWELRAAKAGRPPLHPPEIMALFGVVTSLVDNDRQAQALLQSPVVWEPIRAHYAAQFPEYKGLMPGAAGPNRWQFDRWYRKALHPEILAELAHAFEVESARQALAMDLCDPTRRHPTRPDLRDTIIGDGTNVKSRFHASVGDMQVDRFTGEIVPIRADPDSGHQYRKDDSGEVIRSDEAGTQFTFLHATTGETSESVMLSVVHVPTGPGCSEMKSSMEAIQRLKEAHLPGIEAVLYDMAAHGKDIDRALAMGIQIHARVSLTDKKAGLPKQRLVDVGISARVAGAVVGTIDIVAIAGAAHMPVHVAGKDQYVMLEPGQVRPRTSKRTGAITRLLRDYRIPDDPRVPDRLRGAVVQVRHNTNDTDRKRKLNRSEVLRLIAFGHDDFDAITTRSRAESMNQWVKRRWPDKRGPAVGKERQAMRLMFAAIGHNYLAAVRYQQRTGIDVLGPPDPASAFAA